MPFDKITHFIMGISLVCILLTLVAIGARAQENAAMPPQPVIDRVSLTAPDPAQDIIRRQLGAIRDRDAESAYSCTTEEFHKKHGSAKTFLGELRLYGRSLYNHDGYRFLEQSKSGDHILQTVEIDEHNGEPVTVIYSVKQQQDGSGLIDSFTVLSAETDPL